MVRGAWLARWLTDSPRCIRRHAREQHQPDGADHVRELHYSIVPVFGDQRLAVREAWELGQRADKGHRAHERLGVVVGE